MLCADPSIPSNWTSPIISTKKECYVDSLSVLLNILLMLMTFVVILRYKCTKIEKKHGELVRYHEHCSRSVLTLILVFLNLIEIGEGIMVNQFNHSSKLHIIITPVSSLMSTLSAILFYHYVERLNRPKLLLILFMFWPVAAILKLAKLVTLYGMGLNIYHMKIEVTWAITVVYCLLTAIDATLIIVQKYFCNKPYHEEPEYKFDVSNIQYLHPYVNLFSQATFSWLLPLLKLGYQRPLELADLEGLPEDEKADHQFRRFNEVFMEEKLAAEKAGRRISLWKCYWRTFWRTLFFGGIMKITGDVVSLTGPLSISLILAYVSAVKEDNLPHGTPEQLYFPTSWEFIQNGFVLTVIVLIATFLQSTLSNNFNHLAIAEGTHLRTALQCLVYKKALKTSSASGLDTGAVVNHMAVDAFNMMMLFSMGHYLWAVPFKIVLLLILLYSKLGYSALIGAATVIFLVPVQYYICTLLSKIQSKALDVSDERLKKTTELLQGIKLLKLYGWDRLYANFVQNVREKELKILRSDAICVAFNTFITQTSSIIVTLVTFSLFSKLEGKPLMPADVFTGLALFNQLTVPLYIIPFVIPMVINAVVSTRRLVDFLMLPEVDLSLPWRDDSDTPDARVEFVPDSGSVLLHVKENSFDSKGYLSGSEEGDGVFLPEFYNYPPVEENTLVSIKKGYFSYDTAYTIPSLRDINVQIPAGKLTIIVGNIGSGKSSLLSAILGELNVISGSINWNSSPLVAYVPQKPWLMNATLKENILFGQPYDGRRYHQVTQACALQPDIDLLPARDMTEIGERGLNLSGGQKQRIALARAFYSPARLIILDDPLSALDAHVGAYVFEHGIKTLLLRRQRTVILVTHKLEFLSSATKVILMESGTIKKEGSPKEIEISLQDLNFNLRKPKKSFGKEGTPAEGTSKERHKLVRLLSRQQLYRTVSTQDIKPRARLVSLSRQMSHDPSSPLPCHDWGDHDDPLPPIADPDDPDTGHKLLNRMKSVESLRSRSSASSASVVRRSWKCPPSRLNSRISTRTDDLIEEEDEEDFDDDTEDKIVHSCDQVQLPDGKLIKEEEREKGKISKQVYIMYMKACTLPLALLVIFLIIATQAMKVGTDFWLSAWSENSLTRIQNGTLDDSNDTISDEEAEEINYYIHIYAILSGCSILLAFITNISAQLTSLKAVKVLHSRMLNNVVQCPMKFFDSTPVGRIINRFSSDMSTIDKKLPVTLPILLRFILLCLSAIIVDMIVTPYFIIVVIPVAAIYYFLQHFFRFTSRELQRLDCITKSPVYSHFTETVCGLSTIRAFRAESRFTEMIMACIDVNNTAFILVNCSNCWLGISLDYLGGIILFIATLSSVFASIYGDVSEAFVGMSMTYTLLVPIYLNWVVRNLASTEMYMSAVERVRNYSKLPIEDGPAKDLSDLSDEWPEYGAISFQNVTMKYDSNSDPVLKNITLTIKPGEKVGICGRTGSGKSSLIMALFRMVNIMSGKIEIDGVNILNIPLEFLRSRLSIIPQEAVIFSGTVRENLDPAKEYTDEEIWKALEAAQLKHLITALPGGLEAQVSDEGSNMSAGQHQLFSLARALIRKSKILVMDEATSSLDPDTDLILQNVVAEQYKDSTVLSIVHRVQSVLNFDKVIVLDGGRVAEVGNPKDLQEVKGSIFASLVKASHQHH
ncbi:ATP-binding cassette sub-family C member 8 [Trichonephila inaurata madagascariensis]|uniref:ATP-binding cassette sub-family C member 8 n=1 Tax=Trichonephila inaurata madagascariensis TaxID=2747483 RepID=A0A8X6IVG9_9ARAC|nr:ATP-binding cassette sub-family C member 8 [Trichonephila inaurata madagascariensis]